MTRSTRGTPATSRALTLCRSLLSALERAVASPSADAGVDVARLADEARAAARSAAIEVVTGNTETLSEAADLLGITLRQLQRLRDGGEPVPQRGNGWRLGQKAKSADDA